MVKEGRNFFERNFGTSKSSSLCVGFSFFFFLFPIENFFIFRKDCKSLVFISCFYFTFRILKVLMQVKATFVTLRGVMSLLGSLCAKGRYVCFRHKFWVNMLGEVAEFHSF